MTFQLRHLFLALVLHGLLFALLAGGVQCSRKPPLPPVIQAVLLDPSRQETRQRQRKEEQLRKKEEIRRKQEEQKKREDQQRRAVEEEKQRQQAEVEARRKAEAKKKDEELQRQQELARQKKVEEAARKEQEGREKEQQIKRAAEAKESMEQEIQQEALQRQVEQEQRARAKTEQELAFARWKAQVTDKVRRNWIRPPSSEENFECKVLVQQLPGGQVTHAAIAESCGNSALNESVVKAVLRSDPLPTVTDPELFQREFTFVFIP